MKKVFLAHPQRLSNSEVSGYRKLMKAQVESFLGQEIEVIDNVSSELDPPIKRLAESISKLEDADLVVFSPTYNESKDCRVQFRVASEYEKMILVLR